VLDHALLVAKCGKIFSKQFELPVRLGRTMGAMPDGPGAAARGEKLATLAAALQATGVTRRLAGDLAALGIPVMVLRGPPVQQRLLGSDSVYRSADVDLLVPPSGRRSTFRLLESGGWEFSSHNGVLWRVDRAAAFDRGGTTVDLHWGLHAHSVSGRYLRKLERALWADASRTAFDWYEPRPEPLLVYLAVHGAASGFHKPEALLLIEAAGRLVTDWGAVDRIATDAHISSSVRHALVVARGESLRAPAIFDGWLRQTLSRISRRLRSMSAVPMLRRAVRAARSHHRAP
jgi:hypothetical protein